MDLDDLGHGSQRFGRPTAAHSSASSAIGDDGVTGYIGITSLKA